MEGADESTELWQHPNSHLLCEENYRCMATLESTKQENRLYLYVANLLNPNHINWRPATQ